MMLTSHSCQLHLRFAMESKFSKAPCQTFLDPYPTYNLFAVLDKLRIHGRPDDDLMDQYVLKIHKHLRKPLKERKYEHICDN